MNADAGAKISAGAGSAANAGVAMISDGGYGPANTEGPGIYEVYIRFVDSYSLSPFPL